MSDFKVKFTLKQHTPIIHFQSDQNGATLRASELKPKFDKYLRSNCDDLPVRKNANGAKSLDYKIKIIARSVKREDIDSKDPLFFGNMKPKEMSEEEYERRKKYFIKNDTIQIEFLSFIPEIKNAIEEHFEAFLAITNFGTRQSKGYGCFYVDRPFNKELVPYKVYSFTTNHWKEDIKLFYSFLRQGINLPQGKDKPARFYSKPAIFSYVSSFTTLWLQTILKSNRQANI